MAGEKKLESVISIMDNLSMPAMWDSRDGGVTFDYGDYICILQNQPRGMVEVGMEMGMFPKEMGAPIVKHMKDFGMKYHLAMFCYWKKGRNPDGVDSSRPALIYTIESSKATPGGAVLCLFTPRGRRNFGDVKGEQTMKNYVFAILNLLTNGDILAAKKLGGIEVGYQQITGKTLKMKQKSGCIVPLVLIIGAIVTIGAKAAQLLY